MFKLKITKPSINKIAYMEYSDTDNMYYKDGHIKYTSYVNFQYLS